MLAVILFLVVWPFLIAATIEWRKGRAKTKGPEAVATLDEKLPELPFSHGAVSGLLLAPLVRALLVRLLFGDQQLLGHVAQADGGVWTMASEVLTVFGPWLALSVGLGVAAGAISGQAYKVVRERYGDQLKAAMDWWRKSDSEN